MLSRIKKIKNRLIPAKRILGTKEVRIYMDAGKIYSMSLRVLNCSGLYIDLKDKGRIPVDEENESMALDNPFIEHLEEVAAVNGKKIYYREENKKIPDDCMVISSSIFRCVKGRERIFYHTPVSVWRKMQKPDLAGKTGAYYEGIASRKLCSGYYSQSTMYIWGYLVLGPLFVTIKQMLYELDKEGRYLVVIGEEDNFCVRVYRHRGIPLMFFPWSVKAADSRDEVLLAYLSTVVEKKQNLVFLAFSQEEKKSLKKYLQAEIWTLQEFTGQPEKVWSRTAKWLSQSALSLVELTEKEAVYTYQEGISEEIRQKVERGIQDFMDDWEVDYSFSQTDFDALFHFGDSYLQQIQKERGESI